MNFEHVLISFECEKKWKRRMSNDEVVSVVVCGKSLWNITMKEKVVNETGRRGTVDRSVSFVQ